jgi:hypothetical protein
LKHDLTLRVDSVLSFRRAEDGIPELHWEGNVMFKRPSEMLPATRCQKFYVGMTDDAGFSSALNFHVADACLNIVCGLAF